MPIYEYECQKCGKVFEVLVLGSDDQAVCPDCGASQAERVLSRFASNNVAKMYHIDTSSSGGSCGPSGGGFS
jgi:putative FmdB family regulatory protein